MYIEKLPDGIYTSLKREKKSALQYTVSPKKNYLNISSHLFEMYFLCVINYSSFNFKFLDNFNKI